MIKIYVANLGKYNEGELKGAWLELPLAYDEDNFAEEFKEFLEDEVGINAEYEEYAIHDYDTNLDISIDEYSSVYKLNELAVRIEELSDYDVDVLKALVEIQTLEDALDILEDRDFVFYEGITTPKELGEYAVSEGLFGIIVPDELENYIDYEAIGRDWEHGMDNTSYGYISLA